MRRKFAMRRGTRKPANVQWADVSTVFVFASVTATTATPLVQLQAPTSLAALTSDPPEDLTVMRMVGSFQVTLAGSATGRWSLALTVADVTWTPGATISVDNDKRLLWQRQYAATNATSDSWSPPGTLANPAFAGIPCPTDQVTLDINPRVKVESGKALYLVAYEDAGAASLTLVSHSMRVLYKRSGRR